MADKLLLLFSEEVVGGYSAADTVIELTDVSDLVGKAPFTLALFNKDLGNAKQSKDGGKFEYWHVAENTDIDDGTNEITVTREHHGTTGQVIDVAETWEVHNYFTPEMFDKFIPINDLTTGGADRPASAETVKTLNTNKPDYEEGTYTPVLSFGGGSTGIVYTSRYGKYTKIGNFVIVTVNINISDKGSSVGSTEISLPFVSENTAFPNAGQVLTNYSDDMGSSSQEVAGYVVENSSKFMLFNTTAGFDLTNATMDTPAQFRGIVIYTTA